MKTLRYAPLLVLLPVILLGAAGAGVASFLGGGGSGGTLVIASKHAIEDIPPDYLILYQHGAIGACPGLAWTILAAIGKVESDHGRSTLTGVRSGANSAGAAGPMQFLPATFAQYSRPSPPGGADPPDIYNPVNAIWAAARMVCANGARKDLRGAIFSYNHSEAYVDQVLAIADSYEAIDSNAVPGFIWTDYPPEDATVPDPTGTGGKLTPRTATLYEALRQNGLIGAGGASCWDRHEQNPDSDHPLGKACDFFFNPNDQGSVQAGWTLANWLTHNQALYGVNYVIWQGRIWSATAPYWQTYKSDIYGCPNPANITGCHHDHLHLSVY